MASQAAEEDPPSPMDDKDSQFLSRLADKGLQLARSNDAAINEARRVCTRFVVGESEQQIVQDILEGSPGMSINTASTFADIAMDVYCPKGYLDN